jgi:hypothetical protein
MKERKKAGAAKVDNSVEGRRREEDEPCVRVGS